MLFNFAHFILVYITFSTGHSRDAGKCLLRAAERKNMNIKMYLAR